MSQHHFITGVAGFIGSQLADALLARGHQVSGVDDFSLGRPENLTGARSTGGFRFFRGDISEVRTAVRVLSEAATAAGRPVDLIWHLAANSDISAGVNDASVDFRKTLQTTFATLEAAKAGGVPRLAFASTSAVYGEREDLLTEESGPLLPISNYGATKLASEALISAAAETYLQQVWIFRFPNVVGPRATHGAIFDFISRLRDRPPSLRVLGDGTQTKPYLHVADLLDAMQFIVEQAGARRNVYNIGPVGEGTRVSFMAEQTIARIAPGTPVAYTGGDRGWVGDVPRFRYGTEKLARLGWQPAATSDQAVVRAIDDLARAAGL